MPGVKRSGQQHLGSEAETHAIGLLARFGAIFHPVGPGNDFGIDGRVEVTDGESIKAEEFFVQIKGVRQVAFKNSGELVRTPRIRVATAVYWLGKLSPTLLLIYDRSTTTVYWAWAHEAINLLSLGKAVNSSQKTIGLEVPAENVLNQQQWRNIRKEAGRIYVQILNSIYSERGRNDAGALASAAADALDVLVDWLAADIFVSAYPGAICPEGVRLAGTRIKPKSTGASAPQNPPLNQIMAIILAWRAMAAYLSIVEATADASKEGPIYKLTHVTAEVLRHRYLEIYRDESENLRRGAEIALHGHPKHDSKIVVLSASQQRLAEGLATTAVVLRDYVRSLRRLMFGRRTVEGESFADPFGALQEISERSVLLGPLWFTGVE